jgi:hypothetical protein
MPGVILAVLDNPAAAPRLLTAAGRLAELSNGAVINALIARSPPLASIIAGEQVLTKQREALLRAEEDERAARLAEVFRNWASDAQGAGHGVGHLIDVEALATDAIAQYGE